MPSRMSDEGQPQRTLQPPKPGICERAQGHQLTSNGVGGDSDDYANNGGDYDGDITDYDDVNGDYYDDGDDDYDGVIKSVVIMMMPVIKIYIMMLLLMILLIMTIIRIWINKLIMKITEMKVKLKLIMITVEIMIMIVIRTAVVIFKVSPVFQSISSPNLI